MTWYYALENPHNPTKKHLELITELGKGVEYKIKTEICCVLHTGNNYCGAAELFDVLWLVDI